MLDVVMDLRYIQPGVIHLNWNYKNVSLAKRRPYDVPQWCSGTEPGLGKLQDYVTITNSSDGTGVISIIFDGTKVYEISGFFITENLNYIQSKVFSAPGLQGRIIATIEEIKDSMFVPDGYYSFWIQQEIRKQSASPFFMAHTPKGWFGALINNAAAQEWNVRNNDTTGERSLDATAIGGLGSVFIVMADTPNKLI